MPERGQINPLDIEWVLHHVLMRAHPPVARCRLLSAKGFARFHTLKTTDDIAGSRACIGCGNCIDACPVLARDPKRRIRTEQRTSLALEALVAEDCDRCGNCVLACPQVDTTIKHYIVSTHLAEGMAELLEQATSDEAVYLDLMLAAEAGGFSA
jgi:ferredoxin